MTCAFCGNRRDGVYLELEVTRPDAVGPQRQLFGAHSECLNDAMADGISVELDLLSDTEEAG
ncbi:MAG: hypothetical protein AAFO29_10920 [Actinomycetota bacterium]